MLTYYVSDEHQDKVYDSRLQNLEKKISILEKRMEPIEEVYFYRGDYGFGSEKSTQEVASVDKRIEHLERKQQWLEKRMLNLEYQCYSKAMKGVPSEEEVSSEEEFCTAKDVANEVISVSTEEDEPTPIISRPSTSKRSTALKGQAASTSIAEDVPKISRPSNTHKRGRASISTAAPAPKRPRGRPPSSSKTGGQKKKAPSTSGPRGKASTSAAAPAPKRPRGRPPSSSKTGGEKKKAPSTSGPRGKASTSAAAPAPKRPRGRPPSSSKTGGQKKKGPSQAPPSTLAPIGKRPPPMTGVVIGLRARDAPAVLWF